MAISRYDKTKNVNFDYHDTQRSVKIEDIISDDDFFYVLKDRERLDQLSRRFLGDGKYWWIICMLNNFDGPFDPNLIPGTIIRITRNINNVISKL